MSKRDSPIYVCRSTFVANREWKERHPTSPIVLPVVKVPDTRWCFLRSYNYTGKVVWRSSGKFFLKKERHGKTHAYEGKLF